MRGRKITRQQFKQVKKGQRLGMKVKNLAEYIGLTEASVRRMMAAKTWPEFETHQAIRREYNVQHSTYHKNKKLTGLGSQAWWEIYGEGDTKEQAVPVQVNTPDPYAEYNQSIMHMLRTLDSKLAHLEQSVDLLEIEARRLKKRRWF